MSLQNRTVRWPVSKATTTGSSGISNGPRLNVNLLHAPDNTGTEPTGEHEAKALGAQWALDVKQGLRMEKRRAAGGWPGTLREAHARATWLLASTQTGLTGGLQVATVTNLARTVYASAKATWLAHSERDEDDWDVEPQTRPK